MNPKISKQELLNQLYAPYLKCKECPLGFAGRTTVVFGEGNPDADIMIIGEAPGAQEDLWGRPFVGRSGKLLDRIFQLVGLRREDIFISNIVKCRPPNNRKPLNVESGTCKNLFLLKQIEIIQPRVICTLGASALAGLVDQKIQMSAMRGIILDYKGSVLIPTYHPAYALRNPKEFKTLTADIQQAVNLLKK